MRSSMLRYQFLEIRHRPRCPFSQLAHPDYAGYALGGHFPERLPSYLRPARRIGTTVIFTFIWSISTGPFQPSMVTFFRFRCRLPLHYVSRLPTSEASSRKAFSATAVFTHQTQLVLDEWVFDFTDLHTLLSSDTATKKIAGLYRFSS